MEINIKDKLFIVTGASSGFGNAVARALLQEGASVIAVARRETLLNKLSIDFPEKVTVLIGDVTTPDTIVAIDEVIAGKRLDGVFINAGGPPAKSFQETTLKDWDDAYLLLLKWKVQLVKTLLPKFVDQKYGRILFSESSTVKQPIENLVLSNSMRLAVTGLAKTLSEEYAHLGITVNVLGPGFHDTGAAERLFKKKSEVDNISFEEAKNRTIQKIKVGRMGDPDDFASLAVWLLSPLSGFVTGQVYCLDGGAIKSTL